MPAVSRPVAAGVADSAPARRARMREPPCESASSSAGNTAAALMCSLSPAWIPPMSGSTNHAVTSRPRRRRVISAIARSGTASTRSGRCVGHGTRSRATRPRPRGERIPDRASGPRRVGTPRASPGGSGRSRPRAHTKARRLAGDTSSSPRPRWRHRATASGRRARKASGPRSTARPPTTPSCSLPPRRSPASRTTTRAAGSAEVSAHAAASPAMPPPTTATVVPGAVPPALPGVSAPGMVRRASPRPRRARRRRARRRTRGRR